MTRLTLAKGITAGLRRAMEADPKVLVMGEDVGRLGGVFRVTEGLQKDFGEDRVIDTPLAESGIVGTAIGMAMRGYRPVVEIQFDGFVYPAFDHITSQVSKMYARSRGHVKLPMVIRIPCGGGIGAVEHHSESPEEYVAAALAPAEVLSVTLLDEGKSCRVVVPESQLSLAIGKEGQNARLAAKLTGYKIDIKSDAEA